MIAIRKLGEDYAKSHELAIPVCITAQMIIKVLGLTAARIVLSATNTVDGKINGWSDGNKTRAVLPDTITRSRR